MFTHPEWLVSRVIFIGLVVEAVEVILLRSAFTEGGIFSRSTLAILTAGTRRSTQFGASVGGRVAVSVAAVGQTIAAIAAIVAGLGTSLGMVAAIGCLASNGYLRVRRQIGGSGAEQLTFIALVTFGLVLLAGGGEAARRLGDGFIAAEVSLAYFASGVSKLVSPTWRGGAMVGILSTEGYGLRPFADVLRAHPWLDKLLCWSVIGWEVAFPLVLIAPEPLLMAILVGGVAFHVACALLLGLNRFVWAFCGCYPAVWATAMLLR